MNQSLISGASVTVLDENLEIKTLEHESIEYEYIKNTGYLLRETYNAC